MPCPSRLENSLWTELSPLPLSKLFRELFPALARTRETVLMVQANTQKYVFLDTLIRNARSGAPVTLHRGLAQEAHYPMAVLLSFSSLPVSLFSVGHFLCAFTYPAIWRWQLIHSLAMGLLLLFWSSWDISGSGAKVIADYFFRYRRMSQHSPLPVD